MYVRTDGQTFLLGLLQLITTSHIVAHSNVYYDNSLWTCVEYWDFYKWGKAHLGRFSATTESLSATHSLKRFSLADTELTDDDEAGNDVSLDTGDDGFVAAVADDDLSFCARE